MHGSHFIKFKFLMNVFLDSNFMGSPELSINKKLLATPLVNSNTKEELIKRYLVHFC